MLTLMTVESKFTGCLNNAKYNWVFLCPIPSPPHGNDWDQAEELLEQRDADLYSSFIAGHRPSDVAEWLTA